MIQDKNNLLKKLDDVREHGKEMKSAQVILFLLIDLSENHPNSIQPILHRVITRNHIGTRTAVIMKAAKNISTLLDDLNYHSADNQFHVKLARSQFMVNDLSTNYRHEPYVALGKRYTDGYEHLGYLKARKVLHDVKHLVKKELRAKSSKN